MSDGVQEMTPRILIEIEESRKETKEALARAHESAAQLDAARQCET